MPWHVGTTDLLYVELGNCVVWACLASGAGQDLPLPHSVLYVEQVVDQTSP